MHPIHVLYLDSLTHYISNLSNDNVVVYEFHKLVSEEFNTESFEEFKRRSQKYRSIYISLNANIDDWPAKIDHAIKINGEWYLCLESSSNYYLGSGPHSLLSLRKVCSEKSINILFMDCDVMEFAHKRFMDYELPSYSYSPRYSETLAILKGRKKQKNTTNRSFNTNNHDAQFKKINDAIEEAKLTMQNERKKRFKKIETELRTDLLELVNMKLDKAGFGEVSREQGRSDILIPSDKKKLYHFIYECKVGIKLAKFREAIKKLFDEYVPYHCKHCGIILFNKDEMFSRKMKSMPVFIKKTGGEILNTNSSQKDGFFRCNYRRPSDKGDRVEVFICVINLK